MSIEYLANLLRRAQEEGRTARVWVDTTDRELGHYREFTGTELYRAQRYLDREDKHRAHREIEWARWEATAERERRREASSPNSLASASAGMTKIANTMQGMAPGGIRHA